MTRIMVVLTLLMTLAGMGKTVTDEPMPVACDVLETIDIAATLGPSATYEPGILTENENLRMSLCIAESPDLSARMTLMVRETLVTDVPDPATLRTMAVDQLRGTIGESAVIEEVQIGDTAIWVGEIGQLTVWHRAGRVMLIFSPTPMHDRAAAEAAALRVLAAFP